MILDFTNTPIYVLNVKVAILPYATKYDIFTIAHINHKKNVTLNMSSYQTKLLKEKADFVSRKTSTTHKY